MAKDFAFLFYVNDWAGGTQWMSRLQRGAYMDLLIYQVNNTSFSLDEVKLVLGGDFDSVWPIIAKKFTCENGVFFNAKMKQVLDARRKFTTSRSENRKGKSIKEVINTSETLVKLVEKEKERGIVFSVFWNLYDKKKGDRGRCEKKWEALLLSQQQKVIDTLPAFKLQFSDKQFQPFPETYLNQKRWEDEIDTVPLHQQIKINKTFAPGEKDSLFG